jgi:hypothetical protein
MCGDAVHLFNAQPLIPDCSLWRYGHNIAMHYRDAT